MKALAAMLALCIPPSAAFAKDPDCAHPDYAPAAMAFGHLKDAGLTTNDRVDFTKTTVTRIASEKVGKHRYRQVHRIRITEKSGSVIELIAISDASSAECILDEVDVFVVSRHLGGT
jgi:hypothetical protein